MFPFYLSSIILAPPLMLAVVYISHLTIGIADRWQRVLVVLTMIVEATLVFGLGYTVLYEGNIFAENYSWITNYGIAYHLAANCINIWFVLLTVVLTALTLLINYKHKQFLAYSSLLVLLQSFLLGFFLAEDLLLFYLFFECALIPTFLLIGIWGGDRRIYASLKFFLYTFIPSIFMLLAILYVIASNGTADIATLSSSIGGWHENEWLWWAFFMAMAVKVPMLPLHTWLPDAHVEAPTPVSMMLAGVMLKMGGYAMLKVLLPFFPILSLHYADMVLWLSVAAVIYTSGVALMQRNTKKLIAYSSISHMGYVTAGIFNGSILGISGAILQMLSHGVLSAGLFAALGMIYERGHSKDVSAYSGLAKKMPKLAILFAVLLTGSIGIPGTSGFAAEFTVLLGTQPIIFVMGLVLGMVFSALYMLTLYQKVFLHEYRFPDGVSPGDLEWHEYTVLVILVVAMFGIGLFPSIITESWTLLAA